MRSSFAQKSLISRQIRSAHYRRFGTSIGWRNGPLYSTTWTGCSRIKCAPLVWRVASQQCITSLSVIHEVEAHEICYTMVFELSNNDARRPNYSHAKAQPTCSLFTRFLHCAGRLSKIFHNFAARFWTFHSEYCRPVTSMEVFFGLLITRIHGASCVLRKVLIS